MNFLARNTAIGILRRCHVAIRAVILVQSMILASIGDPTIVALAGGLLTLLLAADAMTNETARHGLQAMALFFAIGVLFAAPVTLVDARIALIGPARLLLLMAIVVAVTLATSPADIVWLTRKLGFRETVVFLVAAAARFVPESTNSIRGVILAQQSRGLRLSLTTVRTREFYSALIIPTVIVTLQAALRLWVGMHLRPVSEYKPILQRVTVLQVAVALFLTLLWLLPVIAKLSEQY